MNCDEDKFWGQHLIMNCKGGNDAVLDKDAILKFKDELIEAIEMEAHGEPMIEHFGSGKLAGWTLVQLIKTSSITIHFSDETHDFYTDIFSCKRFSVHAVRELVLKHFAPKQTQELTLDRGI
jgi:S-adenosylmethionine/arginine decarboxylase-like enzyme